MTSEVVNLRERIEKVRAEMAGESNIVEEDAVSALDELLEDVETVLEENSRLKYIHSLFPNK